MGVAVGTGSGLVLRLRVINNPANTTRAMLKNMARAFCLAHIRGSLLQLKILCHALVNLDQDVGEVGVCHKRGGYSSTEHTNVVLILTNCMASFPWAAIATGYTEVFSHRALIIKVFGNEVRPGFVIKSTTTG